MTNTTPKDSSSEDVVNHPSHYTQYPVEVIELTGYMDFARGNAVKYIARAGFKGGPEKELEDLKKAKWYIEYAIKRVQEELAKREATKAEHPSNGNTTVINIHPSSTSDEKVAELASKRLNDTSVLRANGVG